MQPIQNDVPDILFFLLKQSMINLKINLEPCFIVDEVINQGILFYSFKFIIIHLIIQNNLKTHCNQHTIIISTSLSSHSEICHLSLPLSD